MSAFAARQATGARLRLPLWDGAGNGWGAVELWSSLREGHPLEFLVRLNAQDKWPFGFSLLELPFVAAGGGSFASATLLPALAFALVPALLVWLARETRREATTLSALAAAAVASALWLTSPLARSFATVAMRETAGAALVVATAAAYLRARRTGTLAAWRLAGLLLLSLFFVKSNYFLLVALPLALHALLEAGPERRSAFRASLRDAIRRRGWRSPTRWIALVALASAVSLAFGQNPGGLIFAALFLAFVACFSIRWKPFRLWWRSRSTWKPARRALIETLALPLWLWSLSPDPIHPRNLLAFWMNRSGEAPVLSLSALTAAGHGLVVELARPRGLSIAVLIAAFAGAVVSIRSRASGRRALGLLALVGAAMVWLHPLKEPRFFLTVVPFLLLCASSFAADLLGGARPSVLARGALAIVTLAAVVVAFVVPGIEVMEERLLHDHRLLTGASELAVPLDEIAARLRGRDDAAYLGATNELSEALVRWRVFQTGGETRFREAPRGIDSETPVSERDRRFDAWLAKPSAGKALRRIVSLAPLPDSRRAKDLDYLRYNAWQAACLARLEAEAGWVQVRPERYPSLELKVASWFPPEESSEEPDPR